MKYQLEFKQIVDFPRCRIYRNFIQTLLKDRSIRTNGGSCLFYYLILCSYANYSNSNRRLEQLTYKVSPGEWICTISDLQKWYRCRFQHQVISILKHLQETGCITYSLLEKNRLIKYRILDWKQDNTVLEYNFPCKKDTGFFFFPIVKAHQLIATGKCSEMDILLDLWIHAVYNDPSVLCSDTGPVVYYRNHTGSPLTSFQSLGERWGHSKPTVFRILKKLEQMEKITLISFRGKHGSMIYLNNYLSIMFDISDVLIDKEEIALKMKLPINIPKEISEEETSKVETVCVPETVTDEQIIVSEPVSCVPLSHIRYIVRKLAKLLDTQGIPCCHCPRTKYILSPLSDCKDSISVISLSIICPYGAAKYQFELGIEPKPNPKLKKDISPNSILSTNAIVPTDTVPTKKKWTNQLEHRIQHINPPEILLPDPFRADSEYMRKNSAKGGERYA